VQPVGETSGAARAAALGAIEHALLRAPSPEAVHGLLVHNLPEAVGAVAAGVAMLDATGEWVEVVASQGYAPEVIRQLSRFRVDADLPLADAIRTDRVLVVSTPAEIVERYSGIKDTHLAPKRTAIACIPIRFAGHAIGAVGLSFETEIAPGGAEATVFDHLAGLIGDALARSSGWSSAAVTQVLDAARSRLAFLSAATRELARSLDRDQVLDTLTQLVVPRFADWASVLLPQGDELVAATLVHRDHQHDDPRRRAGLFRCPTSARTVSARVFRTGEPATVRGIDDDVRARMAAYPELATSLGATQERIVVPITAQAQILGILTLGDTGLARFEEDDLTVAIELATRAGTALEHATRFAAERTMVEVLQRAVLPTSLPAAEAYGLEARYLPSSVQAKVGGDWYDAFRLRDGRIGLCVGDVVGHGIEAAACMGQLRNALRAYALDGQSPAEVVGALNAFTIDTQTTDFATLTYATYDPTTGEVAWTSAGHPPPLCRRPDRVETLTAGHGLPIGVVRDTEYATSRTVLAHGDLLVVFTDGLVETRHTTLDAGLARLADILEARRGAPVADAVDHLVQGTGADRADDICVIALEHRSTR
jgi:serine phosphatase RsbU (regulator of sigma subunit)